MSTLKDTHFFDDCALADDENAGGVADTAAVEGHVHDLLFDTRVLGPIHIVGLEYAPAILALEAGKTALGAVANHLGAVLQYLQGTS